MHKHGRLRPQKHAVQFPFRLPIFRKNAISGRSTFLPPAEVETNGATSRSDYLAMRRPILRLTSKYFG